MLLFFIILIGLYLFLNPPVTVTADLPPFPAQVEIVVKPGVSPYEVQAVRRSLSYAAQILQQEAGLSLQHPVKVILTPDITSYYQALISEEQLDNESALYQASISAGTTKERHILLNLGATPQYDDLVFIAAHELTHQFQFEQDGNWSRNNWIIEGMAEVIAATVVGVNQGNRQVLVDDYRQSWISQLRKAAPALPVIARLDRRNDWLEAFNQYHTVPYRYSAIAVFHLADAKGLEALGEYVRLRNRGTDAEEAFQKAFGQSMSKFFQEQDNWLKEKTDARNYDLKAHLNNSHSMIRIARVSMLNFDI